MSVLSARAPREARARCRRAPVTALLVLVALAAGVVAAPGALADVSQGDIQSAEAAEAQAAAAVRAAEADLEAGSRRLERLEESLASVIGQLADQEEQIDAGRTEARDRIARMYMTAGVSGSAGLLGIGRIVDLPAHIAYLGALADQDREFVNQLAATREDLLRLRALVEDSIAGQEQVVAGLAAVVEDRRADLREASERVSSVRAQWERQEEERRAREEAERARRAEEEQRRRAEEEQRRREEEQRRLEALAALQAAAIKAAAAGWTPGAGVEPWRPLVQKHFPPELVEDALAVMDCESKGDPLAVNRYSAASGLFQHLPYYWPSRAEKAGWAGADIFDPEANIAVSAWLVDVTVRVEHRDPWAHWSCKP